jgi:hypothetical protein
MLLFCEHEGSRGVAGNGEEMAVTKLEQKKDKEDSKPESTTGKTTGNKTPGKRKREAKGETSSTATSTEGAAASKPGEIVLISRSAGAKLGRSARGKGAVLLRRAADKQVLQHAVKLAELLSKEALEGKLASAKMLVGLAERVDVVPQTKPKRQGPTEAQILANDKPWEGSLDDEEDFDPPLPEPLAS